MASEKIILGIDPGTNVMGYGLLKVVGNKASMMAMGVIDMRKESDPYLRLGRIFERVTGIIDEFLPDEMAIEAPFFGKNVQSMLKLGRAQGVAIAAAIHHSVPIHEYAPLKIKMAITGQGQASKEQVAGMLFRLLGIKEKDKVPFMDATDALAAAYCHFLQAGRPETGVNYRGWKDFINKNRSRVSQLTGNAGNGITGKDTLKIEDTAVSVTAANHGINGKDCLVLRQADVTVTSGGDALRATNDSDTALGCVLIGASALTLTAGEDGIQAETTLTLFDTTGTVTSGEPTVTDICPVPGVTEAELLGAACALEQKSEHPLAKAVLRRAQADGLTAAEVTAFQALPGSGLQAMLDGQLLCGGNADFIRTVTALPDTVSAHAQQLAQAGKTPLFFARGGKLLGVIAVADVLKPDSPQAIRELQNMGIRVVMITGDNARTARAIGAQAGVDEVIAGVLPDGKEREIRRLSARGKVAMVGDGINDAPALTRADIGIAIGAGTDVAIDAADVVLVNSHLSDVPAAIRLSRATLRNIHENLFWAFFYNTIGIPIAAGVFVPLGLTLNPMIGAAAMSLSSFCVVTNALRLNLFKLRDTRHDHKRANHLKEVPEIKEETAMKKTIQIEGMMCAHCEATVKKALEALPEVTEAAVSHTAGTAVVTLSAPVDDAVLKSTVEAKDYKVTGIA